MLSPWTSPSEIPPVRVLRVWLDSPLTLGHILLLHDMASPVVTGKPFSHGDLAVAVAVCSAPSTRVARAGVRHRLFSALVWLWARRCSAMDMQGEAERFGRWFAAQCDGPHYVEQERPSGAKPRQISAPWYISLRAMAVGELGMSVAETDSMPVRTLRQMTAALAEVRGVATIQSESSRRFVDRVLEWEAERERVEK